MPDRTGSFESLPTTQHVLACLSQRSHRAVGGLWGASTGLLIATLQRHWRGGIVAVTADDDESLSLQADVACFQDGRAPAPLVLVTELRDFDDQVDQVTRSQRLQTLSEVHGSKAFLLLTSLSALLQPVPSRRTLRRGRTRLEVGGATDQDRLLAKAIAAGLRKVPVVLAPGEVSSRGDVFDVYPLAAAHAVRVELFDGEVESIRTFDPASQRSLDVLQDVELDLSPPEAESDVLEYVLRKDLLVLHYEPLRIEDRRVQVLMPGDEHDKAWQRFAESTRGMPALDLAALPSHDLDYKILSAGSAVGSGETDPLGRLRSIRGMKGGIDIVCRTGQEQERLREIFAHKGIDPAAEQVHLWQGGLSRGFRIPDIGLTVVSNTEFAGVPPKPRAVEKEVVPSRALQSFFELGPGDIVVHAVHGIARFVGIELVKRADAAEDHLRLLFRDDVSLLVPASKIHLVQKYVGSGEQGPKLDKLGGKSFSKRKADVAQSLFDMASDLLALQADRETIARTPYPPDALEDEFLDSFPFTDTADQSAAWREVRADLEKARPMDRLLCGDVGFGKTEVAMRAAFKVAITGRQVAVLVPTTVLAEQHGRTFEERFAPHGLRVEVLSRFRAAKERRVVLADTAAGKVDVLVGTHRILSDDVHFRDLGMMVVDEEQRFGVRHKEHLKRLRRTVDVLTLSATPIPRTMHASLVGIRDVSTLTQPPVGRQDVETRMAFKDPVLVQRALRRELQRDGQVYYLHNRVQSIERVASEVRALVPEAKVVVGHGQMTEAQMDKALRTFVRGEANVLVCTTIIENGLDLARANTMLIEDADHFGLAELHQLRGRVGRSSLRAHCVLMLDRTRPLAEDARKRLKAIEELSSLGAGFAIAMKDLEIRGAGNILGPQQSGHIAAVGYEMYCRLLQGAMEGARDAGPDGAPAPLRYEVREVDVDLRLQAYVPEEFVPDPKMRLDLLREMDGAMTVAACKAIGGGIADRFGGLPGPVRELLLVFLLKHLLLDQGVLGVQLIDRDRLIVRHPPQQPVGGAWLDHFAAVRPVESGKTHLILPARRGGGTGHSGPEVLRLLLKSLLGEDQMPMIEGAWSGSRREGRRPRRIGSS